MNQNSARSSQLSRTSGRLPVRLDRGGSNWLSRATGAIAQPLVIPRPAVPHAIPAQEIRRRIWHILPGFIPFLLDLGIDEDPLTPMTQLSIVLGGIVLTATLILTFRTIARPGERNWLINLISYPASVITMLILFPGQPELAAVVITVLAFGDGMACLTGMLLGRKKLPWNQRKSWAGTLAFVAFATPMATMAYWRVAQPSVPLTEALAVGATAAVLGAVVESLPLRLTDNLRVGATAAFGAILATAIFVGWS